jgi:hypothetical protein
MSDNCASSVFRFDDPSMTALMPLQRAFPLKLVENRMEYF